MGVRHDVPLVVPEEARPCRIIGGLEPEETAPRLTLRGDQNYSVDRASPDARQELFLRCQRTGNLSVRMLRLGRRGGRYHRNH